MKPNPFGNKQRFGYEFVVIITVYFAPPEFVSDSRAAYQKKGAFLGRDQGKKRNFGGGSGKFPKRLPPSFEGRGKNQMTRVVW